MSRPYVVVGTAVTTPIGSGLHEVAGLQASDGPRVAFALEEGVDYLWTFEVGRWIIRARVGPAVGRTPQRARKGANAPPNGG